MQACTLMNWADIRLDCGDVCKHAGPCVGGFEDTVFSWGGHWRNQVTQRAPGKSGPHLTLSDPHILLPQLPPSPQWPMRKEGGTPQDLGYTLWWLLERGVCGGGVGRTAGGRRFLPSSGPSHGGKGASPVGWMARLTDFSGQ